MIVRLWDNAGAEFVPFLAFDPEIRRVVFSADAIGKTALNAVDLVRQTPATSLDPVSAHGYRR